MGVWWSEDWPVFGVSWEDLMAFAAWRSRNGRRYTLPGALEAPPMAETVVDIAGG